MSPAEQIELNVESGRLIARIGQRQRELTFEQAFSLGHSLLSTGKYQQAEGIFAVLARVRGRGPRAKVMLARCRAEITDFEACRQILSVIFEGEKEPIASEFQTAFVFHSIGFHDDAIRELLKIVQEHPDLPTACLFLGDLLREAGKLEKAVQCWQLAIKRDRRNGGVALAAKKQLHRFAKQSTETIQKRSGRNNK